MAKITQIALIALIEKGLSDVQIAAASGLTRQAVSQRRRRLEARGMLGSATPAVAVDGPVLQRDPTDPHRMMLEGSVMMFKVAYGEQLTDEAMDQVREHMDAVWYAIGFDPYWSDDDSPDPSGRIKPS